VGNKSSDTWGYVITIIILALLFVLVLPVLGLMYMDIHQERVLIANDLKRIEKLKKELEAQKEK
jgi:F0F1-type ATP synthase membrane subunit b/b'